MRVNSLVALIQSSWKQKRRCRSGRRRNVDLPGVAAERTGDEHSVSKLPHGVHVCEWQSAMKVTADHGRVFGAPERATLDTQWIDLV